MKAKKIIIRTLIAFVISFWVFIITCGILSIKGTEKQGVLQNMSDLPHIGETLKDFPTRNDIEYFYKTSHMIRLVYFRTKVNDNDVRLYFENQNFWEESPPSENSIENFAQEYCYPIYPSDSDIVFYNLPHPRVYIYYMPTKGELTGYSIINLRN